MSTEARPREQSTTARPAGRPRLLLLEPDNLTRWSIQTYLHPWFEVDAAESRETAGKLAARQPYSAIVLSDQLPTRAAEAIRRLARRRNPDLTMVQMVTGTRDPTSDECIIQLEKPFKLAKLARLLGVAEHDIPNS
jgi:DNA-binding response OmpR family regulator